MISKENTYIRTKNGKIDKVIDDYQFSGGLCGNYILCLKSYYNEDEIKTFSDDIFDLLEDGDYINGLQIHRIYMRDNLEEKIFHSYNYDVEDKSIHTYVFTKDGGYPIESVVTKEMFEEVGFDVYET